MKNFMKGCAVTALIFAVLGSALAFVGSSVAGRTTIGQVVETVTKGRVHVDPYRWWIWQVGMGDDIIDAGIADFDELLPEYGDSSVDDVAGEYQEPVEDDPVTFVSEYEIAKGDVEKFCPGADIRNLEIDAGGCAFTVLESEDDFLYLEAYNAYKFQSYLKGATLHVKSESKSGVNWTESDRCEIILYVPHGYRFEKVEADLGMGYLNFGDLYTDELSLEVGAGEIDITYLEARKAEISVGAGSVVIDDMSVDRLEAEVGMGSFQTGGKLSEEADIECAMGYVEMYLSGKESDFNYDLGGSMGNVEIGDMSFSGFGQEKKIVNGASKNIEAECSMGNITILFTE